MTWLREFLYRLWAGGVIRSVLVLAVAVLVYRGGRAGIRRLFADDRVRGRYLDRRRADTLASTSTSLLRYTVYFLSLGTILPMLGVNVSALVAAAGIGGVAVAFGAQHLIRDIITGFFLLFEDQLAVGDQVTAAGVTGTVEDAGLRVTRIRDAEGRLHTIPNGQITQVANLSAPVRHGYVDVPLSGRDDLIALEEIAGRVCREFTVRHEGRLLDGPQVLGILPAARGLIMRVSFKSGAGERERFELELRRELYLAVTGAGLRWMAR